MTLRQTLLQAAGRVRATRPDVAARAEGFVRAHACPGGGFADRSGRPDLYYTVFGLQTLAAVAPAPLEPGPEGPGHLDPAWDVPSRKRMPRRFRGGLERHRAYLTAFDADDLDFVHLCCLLRCWALLSDGPATDARESLPGRLETFRAADGGYSHVPSAPHSTAYGAFLALGAYQDAGADPPAPDRLAEGLAGLRAADGGYANAPGVDVGLVPSTAAAVVTLADLGRAVEPSSLDWLLAQQHSRGSWPAGPGLPTADLLSTATALHALGSAGGALDDAARAAALAFVESLAEDVADPAGPAGFRGHPADTVADCEYTFYGLLAMGHLT